MRTKTKILIALSLILLLPIGYKTSKPKRTQKKLEEAPRYSIYYEKTISFFDLDGAQDMRAYVKFNGQKIEMTPERRGKIYARFYIPKEALEQEKPSRVWAEDPNGNKSPEIIIGELEKEVANNHNNL